MNEAIGADVDEWIGAIRWAQAWDEAHENVHAPKERNAEDLEKEREDMTALASMLDERRDEIRRTRAENGLPNR